MIKGLLEAWRAHSAGRLTSHTYPVHLDLNDAARIHALAELFPGRSCEQVITDLVSAALAELQAAIPYEPGTKEISRDEQGDPVYEDAGLMPRYMALTRKYQQSLKKNPA